MVIFCVILKTRLKKMRIVEFVKINLVKQNTCGDLSLMVYRV